MIIGLSGYSGSGKDTVGAIIQYLNCSSVGETTLEDILKDHKWHQWWLEDQSTWEIKKWAGKLKTIASLLTGIEQEKFEDQEFKKTYLGPEWNYWTISIISNGNLMFQKGRFTTKQEADDYVPHLVDIYGQFHMEYVVGMQQMTVRQFLQELGTDGLRNGLHPNTWVNALMSEYKPGPFYPEVPVEDHAKLPNWIITDTRFPNEAQAIKDAGGIIIRIDRPGVKPVNPHPSETSLDDWNFDYKIMNGSDLVSLVFTVFNILKKERLLNHYINKLYENTSHQ